MRVLKHTSKLIFLGLAGWILITACALEDTNINPNNPTKVPLSGLLPTVEVGIAYSYAGDYSIKTSVIMQQIAGIGGFAVNDDRYNIDASAFSGPWGNTYANVLNELSTLIEDARATSAPRYLGIGLVLRALALGTLTDVFGDIPSSEALNPEILAPGYDTQEEIYAEIQSLLDEAIVQLDASPGVIVPTNDDVIFKGDAAKWKAVAWTLKARYALHLSRLDPTSSAQQALNALYDGGAGGTYRGISGNANDLQVVFGSSNNQASPWFTQNAGRPGWYGMGKYLVDLLNGTPPTAPIDPRRAAFAAPRPAPAAANTYVGSPAGKPGAASNIVGANTYYGKANSPVTLVTFSEAKFIELEARLLLNAEDPGLQTLLEGAVKSSFDKVTVASDTFATTAKKNDYVAKRALLSGTAQEKLATIITQKYLALYLNPEVWVDYRRTGYPVIQPAEGGATALNPAGEVPRRFPYPTSEITQNPSIPTLNANLQTPRLWWDKP